MREAVEVYADPTAAGVIPSLVDAMRHRPELARAGRSRFSAKRRGALREVLERGVARGDVRADLDLELALDVLGGALFYRLLIAGGPIDERLAEGSSSWSFAASHQSPVTEPSPRPRRLDRPSVAASHWLVERAGVERAVIQDDWGSHVSDNDRGERGLSRRDFLERAVAGAAAVGAGGLLAACRGRSGEAAATATGSPQTGGVLRIGIVGAGTKESIDAKEGRVDGDLARLPNLYEPLVGRHPDYAPFMQLAESIESNATADEWTIRLRDGIEFHNGKTLAAEDVLHSFQRIADPKSPGSAVSLLALVDFRRSKILDRRTLHVRLAQPLATFVDNLADEVEPVYIVPVGFDVRKPVGTGAFRFESFTPGEQSVFVRNENYWGRKAYAEKLVVISIQDDTSRVNALLSHQVDAISSLPASRISHIQASPDFRTLISQTQNWIPIVMLTTAPPFDDRRVRQAFRLLADRDQIVAQAFSGHALVGNDLYSPFDPLYDHLPQRHRDVEHARFLLKQAGHEGLSHEFVAAPITGGVLDVVQVFATQAKDAGMNLKIRQVDLTTWWANFGKWPLTMSWWLTHPFTVNTIALYGPRAVYPEEGFDDPRLSSLVTDLTRSLDPRRRSQIASEIQSILFDRSGHVIWGFPHTIDAYSTRITGLRPNRGGVSLNNYNMKDVGFSGRAQERATSARS